MKAHKIFTLFFVIVFPIITLAQFVTVSGNKFLADGKEIIMNGANTPWNKWNDFGGSYTSSWWDAEFQKIKAAGLVATAKLGC